MTRIHTTGRDAWNEPRSPYNDAQRQWAYGPVQPMADEHRPSHWFGLMALAAFGVVLIMGVVS